MFQGVSSLMRPADVRWFGKKYAAEIKKEKPQVTIQVRNGDGAVAVHRGALQDFVSQGGGTLILDKGGDRGSVPCRVADVSMLAFA